MQQNWFIQMVEQSPDYLVLLDSNLKILFINKSADSIERQDLIGAYAPVLTGPKMEEVEMTLKSVMATGEFASYQTHFDDAMGFRRYFNNRVVKLEQPVGEAVLYIVSEELRKEVLNH